MTRQKELLSRRLWKVALVVVLLPLALIALTLYLAHRIALYMHVRRAPVIRLFEDLGSVFWPANRVFKKFTQVRLVRTKVLNFCEVLECFFFVYQETM